jgi:hypothetical protein
MICPRCGVVNAPERGSCTRCSGSLAPPSRQDEQPLPPVMPITRRHEIRMGQAAASAPAGAAQSALPPASVPDAATQGAPNPGIYVGASGTDLYLLSSERSTGQPEPPDGPLNRSERLPVDRPARLAVGLSRA